MRTIELLEGRRSARQGRDAMERMGAMDSRIQAVWPGARVAGSAFTVRLTPSTVTEYSIFPRAGT